MIVTPQPDSAAKAMGFIIVVAGVGMTVARVAAGLWYHFAPMIVRAFH